MKRNTIFWVVIAVLVIMVDLSGCAHKSNCDCSQKPNCNCQHTDNNDLAQEGLGGSINGHDWVDMGTSVKWATTNVGSSKPKGRGNFFAWGQVIPAPGGDYSEDNYRLNGGTCIDSISGNVDYDAARANWGSTWRLPTDIEWLELMNKCDWKWYGSGYEVTAENGNVLYLPAAGYQLCSRPSDIFRVGIYRSASLAELHQGHAWVLYFASGGSIRASHGNLSEGCSVRPVSE